MLRSMKILLVLAVAMWGFIGAFHNVADWEGTLGAVGAATSMTTFDGGANSWQAIASTPLNWAGAGFIMLSKVIAAVLCCMGAWQMFQARQGDTAAFTAAKRYALTGCAVAVFMLFGGFIVIAETFFELWRSEVMRGPVLGSAFRYGGMIALIGIFVACKED